MIAAMLTYSSSRVGLLRQREAGANFTKGKGGKPLAEINRSLKRLTQYKATNKTTSKSITSTVSVNNLGSINSTDGEALSSGLGTSLKLVGSDDNGVLKTLSNDNDTGTSSVSLGENSNCLGNGLNVSRLDVVRLGVSKSLRLVTNKVIPVDGGLVKRLLEKLRKEGSRQVHREDLVGLSSVLTKS